MTVPRAQAEEIFRGLPVDLDLFERQPETEEEAARCFASKLWRLHHLYHIIDKRGRLVRFRPNLAQLKVYAQSMRHPRLVILKSRQQGISTFWLLSFFDDVLTLPNLSVGLMAHGQAEAGVLLRRVETAWDNLDPQFKEWLGVRRKIDNSQEQGFSNGSTIYIRTSFRSATLHRLHISEYGKIARMYPERAREVRTGTLQAIAPHNTVVIESTAEGENDYKRMWDASVNALINAGEPEKLGEEDFNPVFLSWLDDPDCNRDVPMMPSPQDEKYLAELERLLGRPLTETQRNFWIAKHAQLGDDMMQEYPATPEEAFAQSSEGTFWALQFGRMVQGRGRIRAGIYDPTLDVYVICDLGMGDFFVLVFFQVSHDGVRIIGEYKESGEGLEHYANVIKRKIADGWHITTMAVPHDANVRELTSNTTREQRLRELLPGITVHRLEKTSLASGIELFRNLLVSETGVWIEPSCTYLIECCMKYRREWDARRETWKSQPLHDDYSHGADALRYLAQFVRTRWPALFRSVMEAELDRDKRREEPEDRYDPGIADGLAL